MGKSNLRWEELENKVENKQNEYTELQEDEEVMEEKNSKKKIEKDNVKIKNKNKIIIPIVIVSIVILIGIIFSTIFAIINIKNNNIVSGIKIEGIDVSKLSREEAKSKIDVVYNEKKEKDIVLKYEDYDTTINSELLETNYNIEEAIEKAISVGKDSNIIVNNYNILFALMGKKDISIDVTINEEVAKQTIEEMETDLPGAVIEPDYYIEDDKLIINKGKEGLKIDTENLIQKIKENLKYINSTEEYIKIPVINKIPEEIDIQKIYEEVHKEVQDAYYTKEPFTIHPEVEGVDFNLDEAKKILEEDKEKYEIPLIITKPKVTILQIGSEAFPDLISTYSTRYDASNIDRSTNLKIACQKINDKVILPGEIFSYNKALGPRTAAAGYKNAKIYENGQVVDGLGGGICQISSTLYNSVLMANMESTERRNHMFVTSYTPAGRDATVVYGVTDFKFKNTRTYPVKIKANCSNGIATVAIYGIKEENEYQVSFSTKTISTIPYTVKYIDDNSIEAGKEKVYQMGTNGMITETYIIKSLNGKVVSTKLLSKDTYNAMQRIIKRGTKSSTAIVNADNNVNNGENANSNNGSDNTQKENEPEKQPEKQPEESTPPDNGTEVMNNENVDSNP